LTGKAATEAGIQAHQAERHEGCPPRDGQISIGLQLACGMTPEGEHPGDPVAVRSCERSSRLTTDAQWPENERRLVGSKLDQFIEAGDQERAPRIPNAGHELSCDTVGETDELSFALPERLGELLLRPPKRRAFDVAKFIHEGCADDPTATLKIAGSAGKARAAFPELGRDCTCPRHPFPRGKKTLDPSVRRGLSPLKVAQESLHVPYAAAAEQHRVIFLGSFGVRQSRGCWNAVVKPLGAATPSLRKYKRTTVMSNPRDLAEEESCSGGPAEERGLLVARL
jgi:hypothetical protein